MYFIVSVGVVCTLFVALAPLVPLLFVNNIFCLPKKKNSKTVKRHYLLPFQK
jgi:hypothetical protein